MLEWELVWLILLPTITNRIGTTVRHRITTPRIQGLPRHRITMPHIDIGMPRIRMDM